MIMGDFGRRLRRLCIYAIAVLLCALTLLSACGGGPKQAPAPEDPAPEIPGQIPQTPDDTPQQPASPGPALQLIDHAIYDRNTSRLSVTLRSPAAKALSLRLEHDASFESAAGDSFSYPAGSGQLDSLLRFASLDEGSSTLKLHASDSAGNSQDLELLLLHPQLDCRADYDPGTRKLTLFASHPYGESVHVTLEPSAGIELDGPAEYTFTEGLGSRSYGVLFANAAVSSGFIQLAFNTARAEPLVLTPHVSLDRIITGTQWRLPENELRVSIANGYDDGANAPVSVELLPPQGVTVQGSRVQDSAGAEDTLSFRLSFGATPPASWELLVRARDSEGHSEEQSVALSQLPPPLKADSIAAWPLSNHAKPGEEVSFVVSTGQLSQPLGFMSGVALTFDPGATYVEDSFNVGAPGGATKESDGIWVDCGAVGGFITGVDETWNNPQTLLGQRKMVVFNITPLGGYDIPGAHGQLFNIRMRFSQAGSYRVQVLDRPVFGIEQTYYQNATAVRQHWRDLSGKQAGLCSEVVVTADG